MAPLHENRLCYRTDRRNLKRASARCRRQSERRNLHAMRREALDPDAATIISRNRETVERWAYN